MRIKKIFALLAVAALLEAMSPLAAIAQPYVPSERGEARAALLIDDTDPAIDYSGNWRAHAYPGAYQGGCTTSVRKGDSASLTFTGTSITFIAAEHPNAGVARVYLDGVFQGEVDLYEPTAKAQQRSFIREGLTPGNHTIRIEVTGSSNPSSSGNQVMIDAFEVVR